MAAMQRRAAGTNSNLGSTFGPTKADEDVLERFPAGLRVLVVDDDTTCLKILEQMLQKCEYNVTVCSRAVSALSLLRERKGHFDMVISDVHMPDMDGFKLLEHVGLEMDLPVIMMSADSRTSMVMKGVKHGACDYLIKPIRFEELKNIWQHVVRKRRNENKDHEQSDSVEESDRLKRGSDDAEYTSSVNNVADISWKARKKRRDAKEDVDDGDLENEDSSISKKPRVVWSVELHQQFVNAVNQLGIDKAVPKRILELMNVPSLTRENVASHLQKYRLYLKRLSGVTQHHGGVPNSFCGTVETSTRVGPLGGVDLQSLAASGQIPPQTLVALHAELLGRSLNNAVLPTLEQPVAHASLQDPKRMPVDYGVPFSHPLLSCQPSITKQFPESAVVISRSEAWAPDPLSTDGISNAVEISPRKSDMLVQLVHQQQQPQLQPPIPVLQEHYQGVDATASCLVAPSQPSAGFPGGSTPVHIDQNTMFIPPESSSPSFQVGSMFNTNHLPRCSKPSEITDHNRIPSQSTSLAMGPGGMAGGDLESVALPVGRFVSGSLAAAAPSCSVPLDTSGCWGVASPAPAGRSSELVPGLSDLPHSSRKPAMLSDRGQGRTLGFVGRGTYIPSRFAVDDIESPTDRPSQKDPGFSDDGSRIKQEIYPDFAEDPLTGSAGLRHHPSGDLISSKQAGVSVLISIMHRLIQLWRNILRREKMGGRTLRVWGFPLGAGAGEVKEFLEGHAGVGTVFALKFRLPKNRGRNSRAYAVVQFTGRRFAEIILAKALGGLIYGGFALKAEEMERDIVPRPREPMFELHGSTLHLGCLLSDDRLSVLLPCSAVRFNFSRNMRNIVFFLSWGGRDYKLESSFESIWEIQLHHSREQRKDFLMLLVVAAPRIYVLPQHSSGTAYEDPRYNYFKDPDDDRWIRATDFTPSCSIGQSSAFCLELPYDCSLPDISQMFAYFKELDSDLQLEPGSSYSHGRDLVPIVEPSPGLPVPYGVLFKVNHMVQNGTLSGPTLDDEFFGLLIPGFVPLSYIEYALERLSYSKTCCFAPAKWLREQYEKLRESKQDTISVRISLRPGLVYIHRAHITPSKVYFYGPEINVSNRVIRHYKDDLENFMRVSFVDEGGERMRSVDLLPRVMSESPNRHTDVYRRILSTLKNGIAFGGKRFEFLAFSSSQLKDSSAWMFASRPGLCAADIRRWMGTFSHIRNVAKHAARLGQSFGSSTETLAVGKHEVEMIPDVENEAGYLFSDGIGKISAAFAKEVAEKCGLRISTPSAFQIRYGGFKGVVAVDPTSRVKLSLRKSMSKFDSNNTKLDVLAYSKHQACYLNRQLITLLSTLGVRDQVFERKQEELVARLDVMLTDPVRSLEVLDAINHGEMAGILKEMLSCGYSPRGEPFLSMMLRTFRACKLFELRTRSRIFIPMGRSMMGCLDETGTLEYGQVFVQVSCHRDGQLRDDGLQMFSESSGSGGPTGRVVVTGKLIVSKNPCLHPGDIRTLLAVDVPALRHMVDCVVFPQKGKRPHPNECSGSDLDGDVYFVSWDPELIPPRQVPPMDYTPAPQDILNRDVTIDDVLVYFTNYLVNDSLGVISNAHTVFADKEPRMAESNACVELAKLFSIAVDFPKTGVPAVIPSRLTVKEYPDFMEKLNKATYESKRVIGKLFRAVRDHDPSALPTEFTRRDAARCYDRDMEVNGFRDHLKDAAFFKGAYDLKLGKLMDNYEIKTEAEILVGGVTKVSKAFNRYRDGEAVRLAVKSLRKEARSWFNRGDGAREDEEDDDPSLAKASAWYHVTYHPDYWGCYNEGPARPHFLSFPWCVHEKLVLIKQMNARPLVG